MSDNAAAATTTIFPRFAIVLADPYYHYFYEDSKPLRILDSDTTRGRKILQEFKFLEKHLPETIFVRCYETRLNLLRAAIIGAPKTPYEDFLFFFDIFLPDRYPSCEPKIHYKIYCDYSLNPKFQILTNVCLGLQMTCPGNKIDSREWERNFSPIFQALLSIQALVLVEEPYFLRKYCGHKGDRYGDEMAKVYHKRLVENCCKSAVNIVKRPPKLFEELVRGHFQVHALKILNTCDCSEKVRSDLIEVFYQIGAPVKELYDQLVVEKRNMLLAKEEEIEKKEKRKKEILRKISHIFCFLFF